MNIRPITIEFTGPPNSGKTTLIHNLAKALQEKGFSVKVMQEVIVMHYSGLDF